MKFNPNVFRQYDIRGVVGEDLDEEFATTLGLAFGTYALEKGEKNVVGTQV